MGIRVHASNFISQFFSHDESSFINTDTIHDGVRPCKVNVFKDARGWGCIFHTGSYVTLSSVHVDKERFSSLDVTDQLESQCVNCYRLTGNAIIQFLISCLLHTFRRPLFPFICWICGPASKDQGSDTMRIPKSYQSDAVDQIHGGVSSFALLHEICARGKDSLNNTLFVAIGSTFMFGQELGKAIQQQLGIGISVDVTLFFLSFPRTKYPCWSSFHCAPRRSHEGSWYTRAVLRRTNCFLPWDIEHGRVPHFHEVPSCDAAQRRLAPFHCLFANAVASVLPSPFRQRPDRGVGER
mmetsp:Transcript_29631/g.55542  ORF Transcript_29631/g.55542 Transcript_29631/m.55542 type:complete len:296 (+) Transcript_29631:1893-2780(+)